jgi:DMSO/TMAO reductase YedYZ molybdopterin-dependent catalytic subunit
LNRMLPIISLATVLALVGPACRLEPPALTAPPDPSPMPALIALPIPSIPPPPSLTVTPELVPTKATIAANHLVVDGLILTPLDLSYEDVLRYPAVTEPAVLYCPGVYEGQPSLDWYGVPVTAILKTADVTPEATRLIFHATDGYTTVLSIDRIVSAGAILAYKMDGLTLIPGDGYPFRLVSNDLIGDMWIRWVNRIEVV